MSVFEQEECSLHVNGVEINKDFNGYQYTLLVVSIPTKNGQSKKEQACCIYFRFPWQFTAWTGIQTITEWQIFKNGHISANRGKNLFSEGTFSSPTFKVWENKVPLFFRLWAIWLRYGRFLMSISESILAATIANSLDCGFYKYFFLFKDSLGKSLNSEQYDLYVDIKL